ncbi:GNAT family N-acetyltransferase [Nocardia gipuzkoensis]|uniref:GNAT family N-acetyltransferase n=1 Tax=Nocardia gipuzkoensis TaxID=2749991 RepID=UPI0038CD3664
MAARRRGAIGQAARRLRALDPRQRNRFGRLDYLSVAEEFRGRSYGSTLTRHVLAEAARTEGIERVYLSVDPANDIARRVYRACGFTEGIAWRKYSYERE